MSKIIILIMMFMLFSCSSSYTPNEKILALKKEMTSEQAVRVLQEQIWDSEGGYGICGSRGFWYDEKSDMKVTKDKILMIAHKRGRQTNKFSASFNDILVFEKKYYRYEFIFEKIKNIVIYRDPRSIPVFTTCNKKELSSGYFIFDLFMDKKNNLKFIVAKKDWEKTIAAMMLLMPNKRVSMY